MEKETLDKVEELVRKSIGGFEYDGVTYRTSSVHALKKEMVETLKVHTLTSLVSFAQETGADPKKCWFHIESPFTVSLIAANTDVHNRRVCFLTATCGSYVDNFNYGKKYGQEMFLIELQSCFKKTPTLKKVLDVAGNVSLGEEASFEDDGVTQTVLSKAGVSLKGKETIPNPVLLAPYRTFPEVEPVEEEMIFRVHKKDEYREPGGFALYTTNSGQWQLKAMRGITKFLESNTKLKCI